MSFMFKIVIKTELIIFILLYKLFKFEFVRGEIFYPKLIWLLQKSKQIYFF